MNYDSLCQICQEKSAPYKCPKCQMKYCSLTCYRDTLHKKCSKKFDENELIDSMNVDEKPHENQTTTNDFVRERIEDILKRKLDEKDFHDEQNDEEIEELFEQLLPSKESEAYREAENYMDDDAEDEGADDEGEERIMSDEEQEPIPDLPDDFDESDENINQLWSYLTAEEKREFKSMLTDGRISHLLNDFKPWKPWWLYKTQAPALITDLESTASSSSSVPILPDTIPTIESNIVPLASLTSILPHVHVRFDVFEIIFAYALISIRYRGDFNAYIYESGMEFLHIASRHFTQKPDIVDEEQDPLSILHTRVSLLREHLQDEKISFRISEEFFVNLLADTSSIIHGPYQRGSPLNLYVLSALSDLKRFLLKIQEYKPSEEVKVNIESTQENKSTVNVFHSNKTSAVKLTIKKPENSKLSIRPQSNVSTKSTSVKTAKDKKPKAFNRKIILNLSRKIDYLLSWTITHSNRLVILEHELAQIEEILRHQLDQYQRDKNRIEKNLKHIRLQQKISHGASRIEEL